jgi:hypothetical protein
MRRSSPGYPDRGYPDRGGGERPEDGRKKKRKRTGRKRSGRQRAKDKEKKPKDGKDPASPGAAGGGDGGGDAEQPAAQRFREARSASERSSDASDDGDSDGEGGSTGNGSPPVEAPAAEELAKLPVAGDMAPPEVAALLGDHARRCFFYVDPQGALQGPHSAAQLHSWWSFFGTDDGADSEAAEQFKTVAVFKVRIGPVPLLAPLSSCCTLARPACHDAACAVAAVRCRVVVLLSLDTSDMSLNTSDICPCRPAWSAWCR